MVEPSSKDTPRKFPFLLGFMTAVKVSLKAVSDQHYLKHIYSSEIQAAASLLQRYFSRCWMPRPLAPQALEIHYLSITTFSTNELEGQRYEKVLSDGHVGADAESAPDAADIAKTLPFDFLVEPSNLATFSQLTPESQVRPGFPFSEDIEEVRTCPGTSDKLTLAATFTPEASPSQPLDMGLAELGIECGEESWQQYWEEEV